MDYKRDCVDRFVKKLFALPFLPEEQIPVTFDALKRTVTSDRVRELTNYIERTWINGTINMECILHGCEDKQWRRGMAPPHQQKSPEVLPTILRSSDSTTQGDHQHPTQLKMISEGKLRRYQWKTTRLLQCRINKLWDSYNDGTTSVDQLLRECGQIYNGQW